MSKPNRLSRQIANIDRKVPAFARQKVRSFALGRVVKMVGTARLECIELNPTKSTFRIRNTRRNQNHIAGVHAAGMALVAETATGLVFGMSVPDDKVPVLKSMHVDYLKRCTGDLTAQAVMQPDQIARVQSEDKGDMEVSVTCTDEEGKEPIKATMVWAWIEKRR